MNNAKLIRVKMDFHNCAVICVTRKHQLKMLWGCVVGFVKKLPVTVYEGTMTADGTCREYELEIVHEEAE